MASAATRCIAVRFVVLATAFMMALSVIGSVGTVFLHEGTPGAPDTPLPYRIAHSEETGEEEADAHAAGFPYACLEALDETFAPEFPPPSGGGRVLSASEDFRYSGFLPRIYRPPIS